MFKMWHWKANKWITTAKTKEEIVRLNHYTNLQLLKVKDNLQKKDKLDWRLNIKVVCEEDAKKELALVNEEDSYKLIEEGE